MSLRCLPREGREGRRRGRWWVGRARPFSSPTIPPSLPILPHPPVHKAWQTGLRQLGRDNFHTHTPIPHPRQARGGPGGGERAAEAGKERWMGGGRRLHIRTVVYESTARLAHVNRKRYSSTAIILLRRAFSTVLMMDDVFAFNAAVTTFFPCLIHSAWRIMRWPSAKDYDSFFSSLGRTKKEH